MAAYSSAGTNDNSRRARKLFALGIDAPNNELLKSWIEAGHLPHIAALRENSNQIDIQSVKRFSNEHCWIPMLTGQSRDRWDHWLDQWDPGQYRFSEASIFDWLQAPVFYAMGEDLNVVSFDLTAPVVEGVNGIQVSGWATELNECFPESSPPELYDQLIERYGKDPKLYGAAAITNGVSMRTGISYKIPCLYRPDQINQFTRSQIDSVERRTKACLELMKSSDWNLFITLYPEAHTAGHVLWHLSQPHPLNVLRKPEEDPLLDIFKAIDSSVGTLLKHLPDSAIKVFYTIDAMATDSLENARAIFLPEFLYRWNYPGKAALAEGELNGPPPPPRLDYSRHWKDEIWAMRTAHGQKDLQSPTQQTENKDPLAWCPANWYSTLWPEMKAFALPSVADGYIRLNVEGREAKGILSESEFSTVCDRLKADLYSLVNARTGAPLVKEVIQVRVSAFDSKPQDPPADLIVVFHEHGPVDCVESPTIGRIGPVPYFRTASHQAHNQPLDNMVFIQDPRIKKSTRPLKAKLEDIPATLLHLVGVPLADSLDGKPFLDPSFNPA